MDTPDHAGTDGSWGCLLRNANVLQREFDLYQEYIWGWSVPHIASSASTNLSEAITKGNAELADTILRSWGVR